jgi:hypothetical protein
MSGYIPLMTKTEKERKRENKKERKKENKKERKKERKKENKKERKKTRKNENKKERKQEKRIERKQDNYKNPSTVSLKFQQLTDEWNFFDGVSDGVGLPVLQDAIEDDQKLPADHLVTVQTGVVLHVAPEYGAAVVNEGAHDLK